MQLASDERGVSHVLGVILVVAVVMVGVVSIVGFGITTLTGSTSDLSETAVERDLTALADEIDRATVHSDTATGVRTTELATAEVAESDDWLSVDESAGNVSLLVRTAADETTLLAESLGTIAYERPRSTTRIAYQGGIVVSGESDSSPSIVRSPELTQRIENGVESLTIHLVQLTGTTQLDREVRVTPTGVADANPSKLIDGGQELVLRINTPDARAWERVLTAEFPEDGEITREEQSVELAYETPADGMFLHAYLHEVEIGGR